MLLLSHLFIEATAFLICKAVAPPRVEGAGGLVAQHWDCLFRLPYLLDTQCQHGGHIHPLWGSDLCWYWGCRVGSAKRGRRPQAGGAGGAKPQEAERM